jgi:hypothetical protein
VLSSNFANEMATQKFLTSIYFKQALEMFSTTHDAANPLTG